MPTTPTPRQWLDHLEGHPGAWRDLVETHDGCLALAAHALARGKRACAGYVLPVPTAAELHAAAQEIHARARLFSGAVPDAGALASICRAEGLDVI